MNADGRSKERCVTERYGVPNIAVITIVSYAGSP